MLHLQQAYLDNVCDKKLPINQQIVSHLQDIFNLLPNLNVEEMVRSFAVKTNDMMAVVYLSSLIRSIIAMHNLINNKVPCMQQERFVFFFPWIDCVSLANQ